MTTYTDPQNARTLPAQGSRAAAMAPQVTEKYWGYEIAPTETVLDVAALLRGAIILLAAAAGIAALAVWFVPMMAFAGAPWASKLGLSLMMLSLSTLLFWRVFLSGTVRVQIDTTRGELREITHNLFGHDIILSAFSFETVQGLYLRDGRDCSQILLELEQVGPIPAGDGHPLLLEGLVQRLRADLGLELRQTRQPDFAGPIER